MLWRAISGLLMNKIFISPVAQDDLHEIKKYIEEELMNVTAANEIVTRVLSRIRILEDFAYAGAPLSSVVDFENDYRFLVSGKYMVFYHVSGDNFFVDRILYYRRNYMRILFGDVEEIE